MDVAFAFAALGAIIIIGFLASLAFEKTKVPDVIVLIIIGLIFGPIAVTFFNVEFVSTNALNIIAPYFTSLALIIILFDGGLNLNFEKVLARIGHTIFFASLGFALSVLLITLVCFFIFGFPLIISILLGAILGGVSSAVVFELIRKMTIKDESKSLLSLESVITDVLCVVLVLSLIQFLQGEGTSIIVIASLAQSFSIAIVAGLAFGIIWLKVLTILKGKPFAFMITIGALLLLYSGVEVVGGSGFVSALIFGLVLGNKEEVARMFRIKSELVFDERIKSFHSEVSFFIRTVFFVFLGLSFTFNLQDIGIKSTIPYFSTPIGALALLSLGIVLISICIIIARYINTMITVKLYKDLEPDRNVLSFMCGRGLAAAALATLPFAIPAFTAVPETSYFYLMEPYRTGFLNITFLVILITVAITSIGIYIVERKRSGKTVREIEKDVEIIKREKEVIDTWKKREKEKRRKKIRAEKKKWERMRRLKEREKGEL